MKKFMFSQGRIQCQLKDTMAVILKLYYRSLMIFFLIPLVAAGAVTEKEIDRLEADTKRHHLGFAKECHKRAIKEY